MRVKRWLRIGFGPRVTLQEVKEEGCWGVGVGLKGYGWGLVKETEFI